MFTEAMGSTCMYPALFPCTVSCRRAPVHAPVPATGSPFPLHGRMGFQQQNFGLISNFLLKGNSCCKKCAVDEKHACIFNNTWKPYFEKRL
jgi:hypothetical protein